MLSARNTERISKKNLMKFAYFLFLIYYQTSFVRYSLIETLHVYSRIVVIKALKERKTMIKIEKGMFFE